MERIAVAPGGENPVDSEDSPRGTGRGAGRARDPLRLLHRYAPSVRRRASCPGRRDRPRGGGVFSPLW